MSTDNKELSKNEIEAMREFHVSIDWRGLTKAWKQIFYTAPFDLYKKGALKVESASRKMMTGKAALFMPLGIVLRNTSRSMYRLAEGRGAFYFSAKVIGGASAFAAIGAAAYFGGPLLAATSVGAYIGSIASHIAVGAVAFTLGTYPVFTAATLTASSIAGAAVAAFSTVIAAPLNFKAAFNRFNAARKGIELTEEQIQNLETAFDRESPLAEIDKENIHNRLYAVEIIKALPQDQKQKAYVSLKNDFARFALKDNKTAVAATSQVPSAVQGKNTPQA